MTHIWPPKIATKSASRAVFQLWRRRGASFSPARLSSGPRRGPSAHPAQPPTPDLGRLKPAPGQATPNTGDEREGLTPNCNCTPARWPAQPRSVAAIQEKPAPWTAIPAHELDQAGTPGRAVDSRLRRCGSLPTSPTAFDQQHPNGNGDGQCAGAAAAAICQTAFHPASSIPSLAFAAGARGSRFSPR